jgi:hypothetical protein
VFVLKFTEQGAKCFYLAVFNFDQAASAEKNIALKRLGVSDIQTGYKLQDLWTGKVKDGNGDILVSLEAAESKLLKLSLF